MTAWFEFGIGILMGALAAAVVVWARAEARRRRDESELAALRERVRSLETERLEQARRLEEASGREEALRRSLHEEATRRAAAESEAARIRDLEAVAGERESELTTLRSRLAELQGQLQHERRATDEKLALLNEAQTKLSDAFRSLSAEALRTNNEAFLQLARENLAKFQQAAQADLGARQKAVEDLVKPLHEQMDRVRTYLADLERQRVSAYAALTQQLRELAELHLPRLHSETANLVKALRQPTARGRWGELQLQRVVEMAGMQPHCDFVEQATGQGEDGRLRPDLIVQLPGGRRLVVDAKAPVEAYLGAIEAPDEDSRRRLLAQHATHVRNHIANLGRKSYFDQFEVTPDFVVMFIPGEAFFSAALEVDPGLIEFGVGQRVIPASPTILIALLKAVAYGWRQEALAQNAYQVAELGKQLYERIANLAEHWVTVGRRLGRTVEAYNASVGALENRVLVSARRFEALRAAPDGAQLPDLQPVEALPRPLTAPELSPDPEGGEGDPRAADEVER
ncbi:MAG: DNA recombination protein RmuC [Armatimonadota bacterium]|nr:DNA recombination protein RmuC [Armatimonadota bacterium]